MMLRNRATRRFAIPEKIDARTKEQEKKKLISDAGARID